MKNVIALTVIISTLFVTGCNSNIGGGNPEVVLAKFFDAMAGKNIKEAKQYVTNDSEGMLSMIEMGMNMSAANNDFQSEQFLKENMEIGKADVQGDKAYVPVMDKKSGESVKFILKKEDGDWKVAFDMATIMEMAGSKMKEMGMEDGDMDRLRRLKDSVLQNISPAQMQEAQKMLDSLSAGLHGIPAEKIQKMKDSAAQMLEQMQMETQ